MFTFSKKSRDQLFTVDRRLQTIFNKVIQLGIMDFSVIQGVRDKEEQNRLYDASLSKLKWPFSKHNVIDGQSFARAVDVVPYIKGGVSYNHKHCIYFAGIVVGVGRLLGYTVRWGGDWDQDGEPITDQHFQDLVHYEIVDI